MRDLTLALDEDIGARELFVGRCSEMEHILKWADNAKRLRSKSMGILARCRKGKTALLQRFYNVLYTKNDPQLIPFYFRVPLQRTTTTVFAQSFYCQLLTQYFAFRTRAPELVRRMLTLPRLKGLAVDDPHVANDIQTMENLLEESSGQVWFHVSGLGHRISHLNDVRILQLVDEIQSLDRSIVRDDDPDTVDPLFRSFMGEATSKYSPHIVTGSCIGWLSAILGKTISRYTRLRLKSLTDEEALEAVRTYANLYEVPVPDATATYLAQICDNDPFYIAAMISHLPDEKDLTSEEGIREAFTLEASTEKSEIAQLWHSYLEDAFSQVDDVNARRIVLYLASRDTAERDRAQIRRDLDITLTDLQLEIRLDLLVHAEVLAYGSSHFHYKALGDTVMDTFFRNSFEEEIQRMKSKMSMEDVRRRLFGEAANELVRKRLKEKKNLPKILRSHPGATLHVDKTYGFWYLLEFPKTPPPDDPDEGVEWLKRYILAAGTDIFENPEHGHYPEGVLRAALECLRIRFEPDKSKWITKPTFEKWWDEN